MRTKESKILTSYVCNCFGVAIVLTTESGICLSRWLYLSKEDINKIPRFQVRTLQTSCLFLLPAIIKLCQLVPIDSRDPLLLQ